MIWPRGIVEECRTQVDGIGSNEMATVFHQIISFRGISCSAQNMPVTFAIQCGLLRVAFVEGVCICPRYPPILPSEVQAGGLEVCSSSSGELPFWGCAYEEATLILHQLVPGIIPYEFTRHVPAIHQASFGIVINISQVSRRTSDLFQVEFQPAVKSTSHWLARNVLRQIAQEDMLKHAWFAIPPLKPELEKNFLPRPSEHDWQRLGDVPEGSTHDGRAGDLLQELINGSKLSWAVRTTSA
mmetsp:Transcript_40307/g.93423  ORF Transcript_40307/g.93423 Transcript_40307/m.93423 type:complete len:241 (-) Transcript_40307:998-1720(-)